MLTDRYELGNVLGRGGMAEVREATAHGSHGFKRRVAVKRLLPEVSDDATLVRMFLDEARITSRLHHAGIVAVLDYGEAEGTPFQVLELVEGCDAGRLVRASQARGQGMPIEIALHIAKEVAYALAHAHEAKDERGELLGIVHRDVKPSNVLVSFGGDVKLGDFGIALARDRCAKTTGLVARGTPPYMSPEQLVGGAVDASTDTFALACTLHALLVGKSPQADQEQARSWLLGGGELVLAGSLPEDVRAIVARALKRKPEERYARARDMAEDLGAALARRLETDPKTLLLAWLEEIGARATPRDVAPTEVLRTRGEDVARASETTATEAPEPMPPRRLERAERASAAVRPKASQRARLFSAGLVGTLLAVGVGVAGVLVGRASTRGAAAVEEPGGADAALALVVRDAPADASRDVVVEAEASLDDDAPSVPTDPSLVRLAAGDPEPVRGGCRCDAVDAPRQGLCHPLRVRAPRCTCVRRNDGANMCWGPAPATPIVSASGGGCAERSRTLSASAANGDPCRGYALLTRRVDAGLERYATDETAGELAFCDRCDGNADWPRTPGAACVGVQTGSGKRARGVIFCPAGALGR